MTDAHPIVQLTPWNGSWADDDPDANFKTDVAAYQHVDPLTTLARMSANLDIPMGALVRYVLAKWATGGSEALLELGPSTVARMAAEVDAAETAGSDEARLAAYARLREIVAWLDVGLTDPSAYAVPDILTSAIDGADPDPTTVTALLDGIDGAYERALLGSRQAANRETITLDEL